MKCEVCGSDIVEGTNFCNSCGTKVNWPEVSQQAKVAPVIETSEVTENKEVQAKVEDVKGKKVKEAKEVKEGKFSGKIKIIGLGIVLILIVTLVFFLKSSLFASDNFIYQNNLSLIENDGDFDIFDYNLGVIYTHDEEIMDTISSYDQSSLIFLDDKEALYFCNGETVEFIEEDIEYQLISSSGEAVAYIKNVDNNIGELYVYDVKSTESELISSDVYIGNLGVEGITLSTDGSVIGFISEYDEDDGSFVGYTAKVGKDVEELGKNRMAIGISDKGKLIYFIKIDHNDNDMNLYVKKGGDESKLVSNMSEVNLLFNADLTQLLYVDDGKQYICIDGNEEIEFDSRGLVPIFELGNLAGKYTVLNINEGLVVQKEQQGIKDFTKLLYSGEGEIYSINSEMELDTIVSRFDDAKISIDGESVLYTYNEELFLIKNITKPEIIKELGEFEDIKNLSVSGDLRQIYFMNSDEELMYVKKDEAIFIADEPQFMKYWNDKDIMYIIVDEELFYSKKGSKAKKIKTADDVSYIYIINDTAVYSIIDGDETVLYVTKDGMKFEELYRFSN